MKKMKNAEQRKTLKVGAESKIFRITSAGAN